MLSSHSLFCRQRQTEGLIHEDFSLAPDSPHSSLLIMVWRQSRDRQTLSVSEGVHGLYSLLSSPS